MNPAHAAYLFAGLIGVTVAFQLALAAGAPWGRAAMGGRWPGVLPPQMRIAVLTQAAVLVLMAAIVQARAGLFATTWGEPARIGCWFVVGVSALSALLNLATK